MTFFIKNGVRPTVSCDKYCVEEQQGVLSMSEIDVKGRAGGASMARVNDRASVSGE
jgi:hypothetical protein